MTSEKAEFKRWFFDNQIASVDCFDMCYDAWNAGKEAEREACREVVEECIRTQARLASNAREALSEASARIYKRGRA